MSAWPGTREELERVQAALASVEVEPWAFDPAATIGGVFVTSSTSGRTPERLWAAAAGGVATAIVRGETTVPYRAGYLALREGQWLERAVRTLRTEPDVLLVDATGRDHPRGAGLALHLGAVLDLPTVGVTDRPLVARADEEGRLVTGGEVVGSLVETRRGARPVCAHAAWRTDPGTARRVVLAAAGRARTPEPLRRARFLARSARAIDEGTAPSGWEPLPPS
ncbi:MAG TPA: endonuclease V [Actinomycetota bacterium]